MLLTNQPGKSYCQTPAFTVPTAAVWSMLGGVRGGGTHVHYLNGANLGTACAGDTRDVSTGANGPFQIGNEYQHTGAFSGAISFSAVYKAALDDATMLALWNSFAVGTTVTEASGAPEIKCFVDGDNDGYGSTSATTAYTTDATCLAAKGLSSNATDCDDGNGNTHPGASETCNGVDDNCDGNIDEGGDSLCGSATSGKICSEAQKGCIDGCAVAVPDTDAGVLVEAGGAAVVVGGPRNGCPGVLLCSVEAPGGEGQCTMNCVNDAQCGAVLPSKPFCLAGGSGKVCVECRTDADCSAKAGTTCDTAMHVCAPATATGDDAGTGSAPLDAESSGCGCTTTGGTTASSAPFLALVVAALGRLLKRRR
jgi:MYXO-CTERM domain-containing protein